MAQKMTNIEEFALKSILYMAETDTANAHAIRTTLKPFQDEKGWERVLNMHERAGDSVDKIKIFIATTENIDPALLKRCQAVIKDYNEALKWERDIADKLSLDPSRALFIELFRVESALRRVEQALLARENVYNATGAKYGAIEDEMESNIDNINPHSLKQGLMANREYEKACREFQFAVESASGTDYGDAKKRYAVLQKRIDVVEGVYVDMIAWEKSIDVHHENASGWNYTCRESFLLQFLKDDKERLKFEAEIFLTDKKLKLATKEEVTLNEDEKRQWLDKFNPPYLNQ